MKYDLYNKFCESVKGENIKIRLEGRIFSERDLTLSEIIQIDSVLFIYDYFAHVQVTK